MNENIITQTGKTETKTEDKEINELYIIEDKNDPDCKLLKKKLKIKSTYKDMKGILV